MTTKPLPPDNITIPGRTFDDFYNESIILFKPIKEAIKEGYTFWGENDATKLSKMLREDTHDIILIAKDFKDIKDSDHHDLYAYSPEKDGEKLGIKSQIFAVKLKGTGIGGFFMTRVFNFKVSLNWLNLNYEIWYRPKQNTQVQTGGKTRIRKNPHTKKLSKEVS